MSEQPEEALHPEDSKDDIQTVFNPSTCAQKGFCEVEDKHTTLAHRIYFEVHGNGDEKVVLIMGLKNTSNSWLKQVEALGALNSGYQLVVFDNRGSGHSDTPKGPYTTGGMARDTIALLDHIKWTKERQLHVVGISMGGMIALKLAHKIPFRLASLTLCVTSAGHGIRRKLPPMNGLEITAKTLFEDEMKRYFFMLYPQAWLEETDPEDPQGRTNQETRMEDHLKRANMSPNQSALGHFNQLVATTTHHVSTAALEYIDSHVPKICILMGRLDTLIPPEASLNLKKHMADAELVEWDSAGHAIHSFDPHAFNTLLERVFKEGRERAGEPKLRRHDSLLVYPPSEPKKEPSVTMGEKIQDAVGPWVNWIASPPGSRKGSVSNSDPDHTEKDRIANARRAAAKWAGSFSSSSAVSDDQDSFTAASSTSAAPAAAANGGVTFSDSHLTIPPHHPHAPRVRLTELVDKIITAGSSNRDRSPSSNNNHRSRSPGRVLSQEPMQLSPIDDDHSQQNDIPSPRGEKHHPAVSSEPSRPHHFKDIVERLLHSKIRDSSPENSQIPTQLATEIPLPKSPKQGFVDIVNHVVGLNRSNSDTKEVEPDEANRLEAERRVKNPLI